MIHGRRVFFVYEQLTNRRVQCFFSASMLPQALAGFGGRVAVYGTIHSRATGEKISVDVEEVELYPPDSALPTAEDVRGILNDDN